MDVAIRRYRYRNRHMDVAIRRDEIDTVIVIWM